MNYNNIRLAVAAKAAFVGGCAPAWACKCPHTYRS